MNTISTVSSISFNTPTFFEMKIKELSQLGKGQVIDWCHWVVHEPDTDQRKTHIHFVLKPSRRVDTNWLRQQFIEPVSADYIKSLFEAGKQVTENDAKPLGCMPFQKTTSMTDWLLYAIHDVGYLFKKGQSRNTHYERSAVKSTDPEFLSAQWEETADPLQAMSQKVVELYTVQQYSFSDILQMGLIAPNLVYYFKTLLEGLDEGKVKRKKPWNEDLKV